MILTWNGNRELLCISPLIEVGHEKLGRKTYVDKLLGTNEILQNRLIIIRIADLTWYNILIPEAT